MSRMYLSGPKGMERIAHFPTEKIKNITKEEVFKRVKCLLEDNIDLTSGNESDIITIANEIADMFE
tara:strand:+ start:582 stop:779 length:198 start_codon:yes stop_codon:yes gene_type:complete